MRPADAHALLAERDPVLPGLPVLLDDRALTERLDAPVRRRYLRYKPGSSAIALLDVGGRPAIAHVWPVAKGAKRAKTLGHAGEGVLLDDPGSGLLVVAAEADRRLPSLRTHVLGGRLQRTIERATGEPVDLTDPITLAHKPGRRWVGLVSTSSGRSLVLRVYPAADLAERSAAHGLVLGTPSRVRLPRLVARHDKGILVLAHLPGRLLHDGATDTDLHRLGEALGAFHAERVVGDAPAPGVLPAAPVTGAVLPEVGEILATVTKGALASLRPAVASVVHGDFSLDQVVDDGGDLGFIDLDRARVGEPTDDLAGALAHAALEVLLRGGGTEEALTEVARVEGPLLAGHARTRPGPPPTDLGARVALDLLGRVDEPFRVGHPDWVRVAHDLVDTASAVRAEVTA